MKGIWRLRRASRSSRSLKRSENRSQTSRSVNRSSNGMRGHAFTDIKPSIAAAERRSRGLAVRGRKEDDRDPEYSADQEQTPAASVSEKCLPTNSNRRRSPLASSSEAGFSVLGSSPFNAPESG